MRKTRTRLTVAQKVEVLKRLEKGERQSAIAQELGCSKRALARLKQERASFEAMHITEADTFRKSRHSVKHIILEAKLSHFLRLARRNGFPITGSAVRRAALKLRDDLLVDSNLPEPERPALVAFQASVNWAKGFLKRCGIRIVDAKPDTIPVQKQLDSKRALEKQLAEFDLDCIFCVDKTLLFYQLLPNEPFLQVHPNPSDGQPTDARLKERVTLVLASNITGSLKIQPTIIGSEAVPQCFREHPCKLPYLAHAHSWIDDATFKTWFYCVLLPTIRRSTSKRVAVIVNSDWAPGEIADTHAQVQLIQIPNDLLADCHPMNCGIMSVFRRSLRYALLNRLIRFVGGDGSTVEAQQTPSAASVQTKPSEHIDGGVGGSAPTRGEVVDEHLTLLDLADFVDNAWNGLNEKFLTKCWVKAEILPEQHARRLMQSTGSAIATSDEQMFFSCCTPAQIRAIRILEDLIINRRLFAKDGDSRRASDLVTSLHETGRRGIDGWLEVESSTIAQRALTTELDRIIDGYKSPIPAPKTPAKRSAGEISGGGTGAGGDPMDVEVKRERGLEPLPHLAYMIDLLSPIQKVVDECDSGNASLLLRNLKHELVRVKSEQERRSSNE